MPQTSKPIFIHSAPRTSSTWFWARFRALSDALCFYEPFNEGQAWLTQDAIANIHHDSWDSRHPPLDPYYQEYAPLIGTPEGVKLFDPAMPFQWYIPVGGLRGTLRPVERAYLLQFLQQGTQTGKTPVIGGWRTLGRAWAIKQALGGFHIFQYRNLWQQWLSFLSYKARGDLTFYVTVMDTICRDDDPYFAYLVACGLTDAARSPADPTLDPTVTWDRRYINVPRDETKVRALELMPEPHVFALFMGLHIYLYLHAQLCADLSADVTRLARDDAYRAGIEQTILQHTGLPVSFADAADGERATDLPFDTSTIDWDTIREHARVAVRMLRHLADPAALTAEANALIDATIAEIRRHETPITRPDRTTITLCMIVKNEAPVIRRCLDSVRPLIDHWVIVDTGSTDGTQDIIRQHLRDLPGTLHERPWRDFAHNRSEALALARDKADYTLIIDADDTLQIPPGTALPELTADSYTLELDDSGIVYQRTQLVRSAQPWRYEGVLHEFLTCDGAGPPDHLSEIRMRRNHDGARRKDPHTYRRDAEVLETALQTETSPFFIARYRFYLAQSYRDCGEREQALENYLRRADLGFWQEEVFVSLYEAAKLKEALAHPEQEIIDTYLRASDALPTRAEALHGAARFCRYKGRNAEGYEIAKRGLDIPLRTDALFVEPWIYETGLLDEYAINAYWSGHYRECLDASLKILATGKPTGGEMLRITANARFAAERLPSEAKAPNLGTFAAEGFIEQHKLTQARTLHTRLDNPPRVLIAILAKQKEPSLPLYLDCIEALDYPKSSIVLYIRTNNNTDRTEAILRDWVARVGNLYAGVEFDAEDVAEKVEQFGVHEWNATRFSVLGRIRNISLQRTIVHDCAFYFVCDVDNFIRPCTLRELVALNLPIVAPFLRSIGEGNFYSNYHAEIDRNGYYQECDQYHLILNRHVRGVIEMPLVHCTYLIRADVCDKLTYEDETNRFEYVVFSDSARKNQVQQYTDNRQIYGYITFDKGDAQHFDGAIAAARTLLETTFHSDPTGVQMPTKVIAEHSVAETLALLTPKQALCQSKIRIGGDADGGYVMLDNFAAEFTCYSLGIEGEVSWDLDMASRGALIFQYDFSIERPPVEHKSFRFSAMRIATTDCAEQNLARLDTLLLKNATENRGQIILKMDIEDDEWAVIESLPLHLMAIFDQIVVEFHWLDRIKDTTWHQRFHAIFAKLRKTHTPIHVHGNNNASVVSLDGVSFPRVIEVSYANSAKYAFVTSDETFPTKLDRPNVSDKPDINLGKFQFINDLAPALDTSDIEWIIEGIFTGPSGIAHVNRNLATALEAAFPNTVIIVQTDGPLEGDPYVLQDGLLPLAAREPRGLYRVLIYQHWFRRSPSRAADLRLAMFWWETTRVFPSDIDLFNRHYDGVLAPSTFIKTVLENSGIGVPVFNVGCGHDLTQFAALAEQGVRVRRAPYVFLHVSDCHPRKGCDILIRAFTSAFRRTDNVKLIIKGATAVDRSQTAQSIERLKKEDPESPNIEFIGETLDDAALLALYDKADCAVFPTRGEGLGLPIAEALAAGKRLIVTGYSGHLDFVTPTNARLIDYTLCPATGYYARPGALWAEPDEQDLVKALKEAVEQPAPEPCTNQLTALLSKQRWVNRIAESVVAIRRSIEGQRADAEPTEYPLRAGVAAEDFPAEEFFADHKIDVITEPATLPDPAPLVLIAILATQKEYSLPLYLECIDRLDYPKQRIILYIRTNNNTDRTPDLLRAWVARVRTQYRLVISDFSDVEVSARQQSLTLAIEQKCDFYFMVDVDNFIRPETLRELVAMRKPIIAPMLRAIVPNLFKSNFFAGVDDNGFYRHDPAELRLLYRKRPGVHAVPLVHMTYLIDCAAIPQLCYDDGSNDFEFIIFSRLARVGRISQYLDNRYRYGYIAADVDDAAGQARALLFPSEPSAAPLLSPPIFSAGPTLPPMHVINLDRSALRWHAFRARNHHLGPLKRFSAIDGATLDLDELRRAGKLEGEPPYKIGTLGCALSHAALWEQAATTGQALTIFEDDAVTAQCFVPTLERILADLPDNWDFVSWGYNLNPSFVWVELPTSRVRLEHYGAYLISTEEDVRKFQEETILPTAMRLRHCFGLQSYTISPSGARAALDYFFPIKREHIEFQEAGIRTPNGGVDIALCGLYPRIKAYVAVPQLAIGYDGGISTRQAVDKEMEAVA